MKKKYIVIALLALGILLLCGSVVLAAIAAGNKNIIGGADFPTFCFVFFHEKGGSVFFAGIVGSCRDFHGCDSWDKERVITPLALADGVIFFC